MDQRVAAASAAKLVVYVTDADGELTDPGSTVATVTITRASGTVLVSAQAATHEETGVFSYTLTAAQASTLDLLTAVWTFPGNSTTKTTTHEVAGRWFFSPTEMRLIEKLDAKVTEDEIKRARFETEEEFERICDRAFVPRYGRFVVDGDGSSMITLPCSDIRSVRSITMLTGPGATTSTTFDATALAALSWIRSPDPTVVAPGQITRNDLGVFVEGPNTVTIEVEFGLDVPPPDLLRAAQARCRSRLVMGNPGPSQRATSFTTPDGQTFALDTADAWSTGIPDIDAILDRYSRRRKAKDGGSSAPASRPMRLATQRYSMFHTGGAGR